MQQRIIKRIGNDVFVDLPIYEKDGSPFNPSGASLRVEIVNYHSEAIPVTDYSFVDNRICFWILAHEFKTIGYYDFVCEIKRPDANVTGGTATYTFDVRKLIRIVGYTELLWKEASSGIYGMLDMYALSAYHSYVRTTTDDPVMTEAEWANSLRLKYGDMTEAEKRNLVDRIVSAGTNFLRKDIPDTAADLITFAKGIVSNGIAKLKKGLSVGNGSFGINEKGEAGMKKITSEDTADLKKGFQAGEVVDALTGERKYGVDGAGMASLEHITLHNGFRSPVFFPGIFGEGVQLRRKPGTQNQWVLEIQDMIVNGTLDVNEIVVKKWKYVGAGYIFSAAGFEIDRVEEMSDRYRVYPKSAEENDFLMFDQALCQSFKTDGTTAQSKRYWRLVVDVAADRSYVDLSKSITDGTGVPSAGDDIIQLGYRGADNKRKGAIVISSYGDTGPYFQSLRGIDSFDLSGKTQIFIGDETYFRVNRFEILSGNNQYYRVPVERGTWSAGIYYYYDRVSYNGSIWLCVAQPSTNVPPSEGSPFWEKQVDKGEQGVPGVKGADGVQYYTWIKYADTPTSGMSDNPEGKKYIGIAVNKTVQQESSNYSDYTWQLTKGEKGDIGAMLTGAKILYKDPTFKKGNNSIIIYNNASGSTSTWGRVSRKDDTPSDSPFIMEYKYQGGPGSPGRGGFRFSNPSRANAVFVVKIVAKFPIGVDVHNTHNSYGNGGRTEWLTSQKGTGKYEEYVCRVICGDSGVFSTVNHVYFTRSSGSPFTVEVAFATVYDLSVYDDTYDNKIVEYDTKFLQTDAAIEVRATKAEVQNSIENIRVGSRNLLLGTKGVSRDSNYNIARLKLCDDKPVHGEQVTIAFRGELGAGKTQFGLYNSSGNGHIEHVRDSDKGSDGIYRKTFPWRADGTANTELWIYVMPYNVTVESWIEDVMLVRGNKIAYYQEAVEDINKRAEKIKTDLSVKIDSNTNSITSQASQMNSLTGRVASAEQKITPAAIVSTVRTSSEYNSDRNALQSQIAQSASQISLKVDNIKIGTNNLINGSKEFNADFLKAQYKCTSSVEEKTLPDVAIGKALKIMFGVAQHYFRIQNVVKKQNTDYTFSCYITRFEHSEVGLNFRGAKATVDKTVTTQRNKWTYVEFTFSTLLDTNVYNFVGLDSQVPNAAFWICFPKLVEGNKIDAYAESQFDINKRVGGKANTSDLLATGVDIENKKITLYSGVGGGVAQGKIVILGANFSVNESGKIKAVDGEFSGKITSTEGLIGGFKLSANGLTNNASNSKIIFDGVDGGQSFIRINGSAFTSLISIRTDVADRYGMSISTYGNNTVGLSIISNAGGKYAINSAGGIQLYVRQGERWNAPGVLWYGRFSRLALLSSWSVSSITATTNISAITESSFELTLYHYIGHTNYSVFPGYGGSDCYIRVVELTSSYAKIRFYEVGILDEVFLMLVGLTKLLTT